MKEQIKYFSLNKSTGQVDDRHADDGEGEGDGEGDEDAEVTDDDDFSAYEIDPYKSFKFLIYSNVERELMQMEGC